MSLKPVLEFNNPESLSTMKAIVLEGEDGKASLVVEDHTHSHARVIFLLM